MLRISLTHALPPRPAALTRDQLQHVFGGCADDGAGCAKDDDCCPSWWDGGVIQCTSGTCTMYSKVR